MLGAIKLPNSGVSKKKFFNCRYPMSRLLGLTILKFVVQSKHNGAEINLVQVFTLITLRHVSGNQHIWIKNGVDSNQKPEYTKRTPLVDFFCKLVTIIASG